MSNEPPARMRLHIIWGDLSESHIDAFTEYDQLTANKSKGIQIIIAKYLDEQGNQTNIGHFLGGWDNYYFKATGTNPDTGGPQNIEYAVYNNPVTGQTRTTVYELRGYGQETRKENVRVNTFQNQNIWPGYWISDEHYNQVYERSRDPAFIAL